MLKDSITFGGESIAFSYKLSTGKAMTYEVAPYDFLSTQNYRHLTREQQGRLIAYLRYFATLKGISVTRPMLFKYANIFRDKILESAKHQEPELKREISNSSDSDGSTLSGFTVSENSTPKTSPDSSLESQGETPQDDLSLDWPTLFNLLPDNVQMLWAAAPEALWVRRTLLETALQSIAQLQSEEKNGDSRALTRQRQAQIDYWMMLRDQHKVFLQKTPEERFLSEVMAKSSDEYSLLNETIALPKKEIQALIEAHPLGEKMKVSEKNVFERENLKREFWIMLCMPAENAYFENERRSVNKQFKWSIAGALGFSAAVIGYCLLPGLELSVVVALGVLAYSVIPLLAVITAIWLYNKCKHPDGPSCSTKAMAGSLGVMGVTATSLIYGLLPLFLSAAAVASVAAILWPVAICIAVCVLGAWIGTMVKGKRSAQPGFFRLKKEEGVEVEKGVVVEDKSRSKDNVVSEVQDNLTTPLLDKPCRT